jgi:nonsense-mediated mRNA decay protein 3
MVQVRQKVDHKRTFLYLEQLILRHNADRDTLQVAEVKDGLNFFYASKQHALKMVDFLNGVAPVRCVDRVASLAVSLHADVA